MSNKHILTKVEKIEINQKIAKLEDFSQDLLREINHPDVNPHKIEQTVFGLYHYAYEILGLANAAVKKIEKASKK